MRPLLVLLAAISAALAQSPVPQQAPNQLPENVIHINVNLVQVDATVTDKSGKPVKDLKPQDFEILQDGKPQTITNFTYINVHPDAAPALRTPAQTRGKAIPPPPMSLKPGDIRRTIALVVDDLGLSFESTAHVRDSLKRFVDREMQPGDLVAIVRTGAGMGSLQQFTSDKRILYAAIDRVKFNGLGRIGVSSFAPLGSTDESTASADAERNSIFAAGTLGAVRFVVSGLRELPGRKAVLLFSESLKLNSGNDLDQRVMDGMRHLIDAANRASVVFYTIDPRGVQYFGLTATDNTRGKTPQQISQVSTQRSQETFDSQGGLAYLAGETGGKFYFNTNDIGDSVHKAVADSEGYYLLAYHPAASTFDAKTGQPKFHSVRVRLKAAGLTVRSRRGFFGTSDALHEAPARTPREQIQRALYSPFTSGAIHARLTTLFGNSVNDGSYLNSYLHLDLKDLQFTTDADGSQKAVFDVVAITFGENGEAVDSSGKTYTIRLQSDAYQKALENGFYYHFMHPVKKPGFYQMRVALRDAGSQQVGSANQFIEVPDVNKALTLSSLVMGKRQPTPAGDVQPQPEPKANAILRIFKPGDALEYAYQILNMRAESGKPPELQVQTRLFREGQAVYEGPAKPLKPFDSQDPKRTFAGGAIQLGTVLAPGDYVLQVIVTAKEGEKVRTAAQSMDFEIESRPAALPTR